MNSPTSNLLNSIQVLKNKLRSDHNQLQDIRKDFSLPFTPIPEQLQVNEYKVIKSCGKECRQKLIDLRKKQQMEIQSIMSRNQKQKQELINEYEYKLKEIQNEFTNKINDQQEYINSLQQQITISIQTDRSNRFESPQNYKKFQEEQKYTLVINRLLGENSELMKNIEELRMQNRKLLLKQDKQSFSVQHSNKSSIDQHQEIKIEQQHGQRVRNKNTGIFGNKNRLKFSKIAQSRNTISQRSGSSSLSNIDDNPSISNYISEKPELSTWDEDSIMSEDMKIRTIKHLLPNQQFTTINIR